MAEKRGERTKNELLSVVVNFESLRFMALVKEDYLISDLITETEKTFTKLCSTKVTIKTLKNSVNAVLPDWYPVAPLIKNGDEIFAYRDTATDVMNNNFSRPINRHIAKNTSTNPRCSVYDSSFSSGITPVKNIANKADQQETEGTKMDSAIKTTESGFAASVDLGGAMSDQESERLSETFSFQPVNRKRSDSQLSIGTEKIENEIGHKSEDVQNKMSNDYNLVVTGMEMKESASVQKSKTNDINNSDSTECRASTLRKSTNDSGVSVGGRSSIIDHSKAQESKSAQKLQETKKTVTGMDEEFEKSHSIGKNSDDNSWASGGSYGDKKRKERTLVQNGSPVDSARQKKVDSNSDNSDSTKKMPKKSRSKDVSEESSDDNEEDVQTTSVKATGQVGRKDSEQKLGEVNKSETSSIHSESSKSPPRSKALKKAQEVEKGNSKKPKIISIKFTKPIEASPACEIKTEVVDLCDSDGESSWTESSEMNTPKKTPQAEDGDSKGNGKSSQVKGNDGKDKAMEVADDSDNENIDSSQASNNEKAFTQAPASDHATGVKNMVDTTAHKLNSLDKYGKAKSLNAASDSDSEDSDASSEKPLTQLPTKTGGKPKHLITNPVSTPNGSNKKAKANTTEAASDSDSEDSDGSSEKPLTQLPTKTGGKPKHLITNPVSTPNGSNKKAKANTTEAASDSDSEDSDGSSEKPLTQLPTKTGGKPKHLITNPVSTPNGSNKKAKANTTEAASDSDSEDSDDSHKKPLTQLAKTGGKPKHHNPVSTPNGSNKNAKATETTEAASDSDSEDSDDSRKKPLTQPTKTGGKPKHSIKNPVSTPNGSNKNAKANTAEATSESDDESSDNSSEKSLKKLPASTSGKSKDPVDHEADDTNNESSGSSSEEPFKQPLAKTSSKSKGTASNPTRSRTMKARTMVSAEVDFNSDTKHAGKTIDNSDSTGNLNTQNAAETNAKTARSRGNAKQSVSPKKNQPETPKNKKQQQKDSKTSPRLPLSPITPRSRKAAVDKSKSKVASWLLANDVPASAGECDNTSTSDQGRIMTRAQKSRKRARKRARGRKKENNEEKESEKTAEPTIPKKQDTTICSGEQTQEDRPTLGSPKKAAGKSQKRKQNETTETNHEEQSPSKNAKRRREKKKAANDKKKANEDDDHQEKDTNESDKNEATPTAQVPPVDSGKRKTTTLTLPKKSKGLSALLEDDDDNFENFQTPKKPKRTPIWPDRPKPTGFLTPSNSMERKSGGTRNWKQKRTKKLSLSQPKQTVELNVKEKELLSSGALNLERLLNDESITW